LKRVLILGGNGMLGSMVKQVLSKSDGCEVVYSCREQCSNSFSFDIEDGVSRLKEILIDIGPFDYVINCIGLLNSLINEQDSQTVQRAILVNALFPHELAGMTQTIGARVIHISTDGVFSGNAAYCDEDSPCDCDDVYGKTKNLGEVFAPNFLTLRCSIVGPNSNKKQGLLEWLRNQTQKAEIKGYINHKWNGVTTLQFGSLCQQLITKDLFDEVRKEAPLHHFCPNKPVTKYELLKMFGKAFRPDIVVKPSESPNGSVSRILKTRYNSIKSLFGYDISMGNAVDELSIEMEVHNQ